MGEAASGEIRFGVLGLHEGATLLGALGTTWAGSVHVGPVRRTRHAVATWACDLDPDKLAACRARYPEVRFTADYDELLRAQDVDAVAIYTPDAWHAPHAVQAMRAGKHVLVTKPLVTTRQGARDLAQAARETGRQVMVGQSTRFFEPFLRQRRAYERGECGELELLDAHYIHRMDWFYDKSPWAITETDWAYLGLSHPVDLITWYLPDLIEVQALGGRSVLGRETGVGGPDIYVAQLRSASGALARVMGHYGLRELPRARNAIELMLYGSGGTSLAQYHDMRSLHTAPDGTEVVEDSLYALRAYHFNNEVHGMHYGEFANYAEAFALALLTGQPSQPGLEEGLRTFAVMTAIRDSARAQGRPLSLEPYLAEFL